MTTLTLSRAYEMLTTRWPKQSFNITLEVWHHDHSETGEPDDGPQIEWSIWEHDARVHHRGLTLQSAVERAIDSRDTIAAVERTLEGLQVESEIRPGIPLTVVKS